MNSAGQTNSERHSAPVRHSQRGGIISSLLFLFILIGLLCIVYVARHPLLRLAGSYWVVDEEPENSDVIVILGDDNFNGDRATRAAELYKSGFAPHIIASGRFLRPYASISELEQHDLTDRGVPQAAIVRLTHMADDTREECIAIGQQLNSRGWRKVILVTSNYHTRRSRYICERVFPAGTILHMAAARDSEYNPDSWWESRQGLKIYLPRVRGDAGGHVGAAAQLGADFEPRAHGFPAQACWHLDTRIFRESATSGLQRGVAIL